MTHAMKLRRTPIAVAVFATLHAAAAHAQTQNATEAQLPRISVSGEGEETNTYKADRATSPKFTEPLLETPQTVTVVRKEVIAQQGAGNLTETLRNTPGITFQLGENGNTQSGDTIFMRGFDTQNAIFLDGIRDLGAAVRDVFNIEQVEIFKGPAGADNGRGATSGYVNLSSKVPMAQDTFASSIAYGTADRRRLTADWNNSLAVANGAAFRLNVMGQQGGVAGRNFIDRDSWGIAPAFAVGLGTDTRFYAYSQHVRQDNVPDGAVPTIGVADYTSSGIVGPAVDSRNYYGLDSDYEDIEADMFTVRVEHDLSPTTTLHNTARYGRSEQERVLTAPFQAPVVTAADPHQWMLNRQRHASFRDNKILTNQTNLTTRFSTGSIEHALSSGVEFIYEKQFTPAYSGLGTLAPTNLYHPDRNGIFTVAPAIAPTGAFSDGSTLTSAVYAFDTWDLTSRWQLSTGLRWEHYDTESENVALTGAPAVPTSARFGVSDSALSWKVGLLFKPAEHGSVYVVFANSLKPPGSDNFTFNTTVNASGALNVNNPNLDPQKATNFELGTKWDLLEGRLAATAALFKSTNENDLARTDPGDPDAIVQYGEKRVKGIELGLVGQLTPAWQISAGLTRQDTKVTEGQFGGTQTGAAINFSPKLSIATWTTYRLPFGLTVGGGARHQSTQARNVSNVGATSGVFRVPSFTVVDLFAAYDVTDTVNLQVNAYNIVDEDYISSINNSGQRYIGGIPRSYLATVNFRF